MIEKNCIHLGNNIDTLRQIPDNSLDSCVTDPPYGINFMNKKWDYDVPSVELWKEVYRVLKPGAHILVACGTRTQHRMAVNIEDAGFEIRDLVAWIYGSGFPKSLDVSRAIDSMKIEDANAALRVSKWLNAFMPKGWTMSQWREFLNYEIVGEKHSGGSAQGWTTESVSGVVKPRVPTIDQWGKIKTLLKFGNEMDNEIERLNGKKSRPGDNYFKRDILEKRIQKTTEASVWATESNSGRFKVGEKEFNITAPSTTEAQQWQGWGTALKPAMELWTLARKPIKGTVAENVLKYGTGGINIDGCRVATNDFQGKTFTKPNLNQKSGKQGIYNGTKIGAERLEYEQSELGRFPANVIHDGSDEVAAMFPKESGGGNGKPRIEKFGDSVISKTEGFGINGGRPIGFQTNTYADIGSAARFFYTAKASQSERNDGMESVKEAKIEMVGSLWQDEIMELVELLKKVTSELTVKWNIDESGNNITASCQSECLYTTLTEIKKITPSQILRFLTHSLTSAFILDANSSMGNGGNHVANVEKSSEYQQIITSDVMESARGASHAVWKMLQEISAAAKWKNGRNVHSTVKPLDLMRYLVRMITPKGGCVLEPFAGSGTTCIAAKQEKMDYIGMEIEEDYVKIAEARIKNAVVEYDIFDFLDAQEVR